MTRRLRDAILLNLAIVYTHHLLVGGARLWLSTRNLGPVPKDLISRLAQDITAPR